MKEIVKKIDKDKLLLTVSNDLFEKEAILKASYKYTDRCFINIEPKDKLTEIFFLSKENTIDLGKIAFEFGNELIDQQVRLLTGREFKEIREQLVKKAFSFNTVYKQYHLTRQNATTLL